MSIKHRSKEILCVGTPITGIHVDYGFDPLPYLLVQEVIVSENCLNVFLSYTDDAVKNVRDIYDQPSHVIVGLEVEHELGEKKYTIGFFLHNLDYNDTFMILHEENKFDSTTRYFVATAVEFRKHIRNQSAIKAENTDSVKIRRYEHILKNALEWQVFLVDIELVSNRHYYYISHLLNKIDAVHERTKEKLFHVAVNLKEDWCKLIFNFIKIMGESTNEITTYKELYELSLRVLFQDSFGISDENNVKILRNFIPDIFDIEELQEHQKKIRNLMLTTRKLLPQQRKTLNILLLGEKGSGKSTMVNSFANYIYHNSLSEAVNQLRIIFSKQLIVSYDNQSVHVLLNASEPVEIDEFGNRIYKLCIENITYNFIVAPYLTENEKKNRKLLTKLKKNLKFDAVWLVVKSDRVESNIEHLLTVVDDIRCDKTCICITHADLNVALPQTSLQIPYPYFTFESELFSFLVSCSFVPYDEKYKDYMNHVWQQSMLEAEKLAKFTSN